MFDANKSIATVPQNLINPRHTPIEDMSLNRALGLITPRHPHRELPREYASRMTEASGTRRTHRREATNERCHGPNAQEGGPAVEDLSLLRATVFLAAKVGA